jgi:hypothetical protein
MYEQLLDEIAQNRRKRGRDLQPPASDAEIADLRKRARQQLRYDLPDAYLDFLRRANGLDFNGVSFYATQPSIIVGTEDRTIPGLVEANLDWRGGGSYRDQIVFGHTGDANYVYNTKDSAWQVRMQPTDSLIETVGSFEELLFRALDENRPPQP